MKVEEADALLAESVRLSRQGEFAAAQPFAEAAVESYRAAGADGSARRGLPRALHRLASLHFAQHRVELSVHNGVEAVQVWESLLAESDNLDIVYELTRCCADMSVFTAPMVLVDLEYDWNNTLDYAVQALLLANRLVDEGHPQGEIELGTAWHNVAVVHVNRSETDWARRAAESAAIIRRRLAESPAATGLQRWEMANTCQLLGWIATDTGEVTLAADAIATAFELTVPMGPDGEDVFAKAQIASQRLVDRYPNAFADRPVNIRWS